MVSADFEDKFEMKILFLAVFKESIPVIIADISDFCFLKIF